MKILQINSVCGIGSTGRIATDIDSILKQQENDSYIAYGRNEPMNSDTTMKIGSNFDNYMHLIKTRLFDLHGFGSKTATKRLINNIEKLNPDVIHLHNIHGYYLNIGVLFQHFKKIDKPVVWTLHDCWSFTGHCAYFDYINCDRWKTGCYNCPQKNDYPSSVVIDNSKLNYNKKKEIFTGLSNLTIVSPSEWLAGLVKNSFLSEYPVRVINNGIDLKIFRPLDSNFREKHKLEDKFIILGVASVWDRRKGYEYFIELSKRINNDSIIVLVGLSEKQMKILPNNIVGIPRTNSINELANIYSTSDVFINPTLEDNFPTTNLESLACGTPVITFNTGGSPESIGECGLVVEKGDLKGLIKAIDEIKVNGKQKYAFSCTQRAITLFDKTDRYNEYVSLYKSII